MIALPMVMSEPSAHAASETAIRLAATATATATAIDASPISLATEPVAAIERAIEVATADAPRASVSETRTFNGRPLRAARTITMRVTAYSPDAHSCGDSADGITASGYSVWTNGGKLVAADSRVLPLGSLVSVPGYDIDVVPVLDRGGAIKGNRLDVLFPTHEEAIRWGVRDIEVTVWEYADGRPNDFRENHWKRAN